MLTLWFIYLKVVFLVGKCLGRNYLTATSSFYEPSCFVKLPVVRYTQILLPWKILELDISHQAWNWLGSVMIFETTIVIRRFHLFGISNFIRNYNLPYNIYHLSKHYKFSDASIKPNQQYMSSFLWTKVVTCVRYLLACKVWKPTTNLRWWQKTKH